MTDSGSDESPDLPEPLRSDIWASTWLFWWRGLAGSLSLLLLCGVIAYLYTWICAGGWGPCDPSSPVILVAYIGSGVIGLVIFGCAVCLAGSGAMYFLMLIVERITRRTDSGER
jgi:hypothetical protein